MYANIKSGKCGLLLEHDGMRDWSRKCACIRPLTPHSQSCCKGSLTFRERVTLPSRGITINIPI